MSFFPRFHQELSPLFRLMEDYDRTTREGGQHTAGSIRSFQPKFDIKELKDRYELQGELPGIEQKDINIEWMDGNSLTISGHVESHYEKRSQPKGFIEGEQHNGKDYHQPTVEDESTAKKEETAVTKTGSKEVQKPQQEEGKWWLVERHVGEFHRTFSFPTRVEHDAVKASLKNGILSIIVPKAKAPQSRKVAIE
ncbi:HSP20-like chaperone [Trichodelitschia bisporula]|uniref:HSP20-like chaperone n=1 Tax=Trichodelitschia bisporula TaxID=703511 RepID=A0A6G1IBL5_9PEZI|nr:HSP20-like chaperone [Trichodelitschia bisporula]